eukprot:8148-Heterococcus_DN1.PRE.3
MRDIILWSANKPTSSELLTTDCYLRPLSVHRSLLKHVREYDGAIMKALSEAEQQARRKSFEALLVKYHNKDRAGTGGTANGSPIPDAMRRPAEALCLDEIRNCLSGTLEAQFLAHIPADRSDLRADSA